MLRSVRLQNFRCFEDTNNVELRKLNVLIGANNAGKSSFLSAVELFLRSQQSGNPQGPLAFEEMPAFASFDSVLRRHWSPGEQRPHEFVLSYDWSADKQLASSEFECRGHARDNTVYVARASYKFGKENIRFELNTNRPKRPYYKITFGKKRIETTRLLFHGLVPMALLRRNYLMSPLLQLSSRYTPLEVIHPYRPVPRSFYVLDDPGLAIEDRDLLVFLIRIWGEDRKEAILVRKRIVAGLQALRLARQIDVVQVSKRFGPKVVEIRVSPTIRRQRVTLADAGFGLSQALPLVTSDARLEKGSFIAYQPEVHLHPFAQSRLADLFVHSVNRGNQVFVETHSPDLILRLQLMVAKGNIFPNDVRVFCFENKLGRSRVTPVDFSQKGTPSVPWPAGFLDTSLGSARELTAARVRRDKHVR
jgi:AAA ATPase-like protein